MKNKTKLLVAAVTGGLVGCAAMEMDDETGRDEKPVCRDRHVTVNHKAAKLSARPEHIEVCPGFKVLIHIVPAVDANSARTVPADETAEWLEGVNRDRGTIVIEVPKGTDWDTYKYAITIDGVGTLDPRITVEPR